MPVAVSQARNTERVSRNLWLKELTRIQPQSLRPQQRRDSPRPWSPCWTLTRYSSSQAGPVSDAGTALKAPAPAPASPRRPQPWTLGRLPGPAAHLAPVGGPGRSARAEGGGDRELVSLSVVNRGAESRLDEANWTREAAHADPSPRDSAASRGSELPAIYSHRPRPCAAAAGAFPELPMTSPPDRPIPSCRRLALLARPQTSSTSRPIPPRQGPVGPPTPRPSASLRQQSRSFSEPPSHREAALRRRTRPSARRGEAESGGRGWEQPAALWGAAVGSGRVGPGPRASGGRAGSGEGQQPGAELPGPGPGPASVYSRLGG